MRRLGAVVAYAALMAAAPGAGAATAAQAIAVLNAQRAANKIPAGITEHRDQNGNADWSSDCALHDHYMATNKALTHTEDPGKPAYTSGGAYAGQNSVLAQGITWDNGNPYESAPLHLDQLLAPRLISTGSADAEGYSCTTTFPGWTRPDPLTLTIYTYPGEGSRIYPSERARELPQTPGQLVGVPQDALTGPYLLVFADAPGQSVSDNPATLSAATLTGPSGPVAVKTVDGTSPDPNGGGLTLGNYIAPGGFVIPVSPLVPGTTYRAHVVIGFAGMQTPHDWSFTTTVADSHSALRLRDSMLRFVSDSPASITVSFTRADGAHARPITLAPGASAALPRLRPGRWRVCGDQSYAGAYPAYTRCFAITVASPPSLRLSPPRVVGGQLELGLNFSSALRGRQATLTVVQLTIVNCTRRRCTTKVGRSSQGKLTLHTNSLSFALPRAGHGLRISVGTRSFTLGSTLWGAAQTTRTFLRR